MHCAYILWLMTFHLTVPDKPTPEIIINSDHVFLFFKQKTKYHPTMNYLINLIRN